jgi:endonuclease/exonuclease/phosphatase family metal-dependent hydrolase
VRVRRSGRYARSLAAVGAVVAALAPRALADAAEGPAPAVRFVTLNVLHGGLFSGWHGRDDHLEARLDLVTEALRALAPDVVALQEASTTSRRGNVASRLAGRLGMNHVYAPAAFHLFRSAWLNARLVALMDFDEGPAVLSRFPILRSEVHRLPTCGRPLEPRRLLLAELGTPGGRLLVGSTHTAGDPCHTRRVAELLRERRGDLPAVLMGDFNAVESSEAMQVLTADAGLVDVFRAARPHDPGLTVWQPVRVAERRARRRVDYILLAPGRRVAGVVLDSRVVIDRPGRLPDGTPLWPSDHYGVLADLAVLPPAVATREGEAEEAPGPEEGTAAGGRVPARGPGSGPPGASAGPERSPQPSPR